MYLPIYTHTKQCKFIYTHSTTIHIKLTNNKRTKVRFFIKDGPSKHFSVDKSEEGDEELDLRRFSTLFNYSQRQLDKKRGVSTNICV